MDSKEIWKPVKGFENRYEVSNLGNLRRLDFYSKRKYKKRKDSLFKTNGGIIKQGTTRKGYRRVYFCVQNKRFSFLVHRLVYEAFKNKIDKGNQINHINGIKHDNRLENLEEVNGSENMKHRFESLGHESHFKGKKLNYSTKKRKVICLETGNVYASVRSSGLKEGVSSSAVLSNIKGRTKKAGKKYTYQYL